MLSSTFCYNRPDPSNLSNSGVMYGHNSGCAQHAGSVAPEPRGGATCTRDPTPGSQAAPAPGKPTEPLLPEQPGSPAGGRAQSRSAGAGGSATGQPRCAFPSPDPHPRAAGLRGRPIRTRMRPLQSVGQSGHRAPAPGGPAPSRPARPAPPGPRLLTSCSCSAASAASNRSSCARGPRGCSGRAGDRKSVV